MQQRGDVPVRVGSAGPFLEPQDSVERGIVGKRRVGRDSVGEHTDPVPLQPGDEVPATSQRESLPALTTANVEHPARRQVRHVRRDLSCQDFLLAQIATVQS